MNIDYPVFKAYSVATSRRFLVSIICRSAALRSGRTKHVLVHGKTFATGRVNGGWEEERLENDMTSMRAE